MITESDINSIEGETFEEFAKRVRHESWVQEIMNAPLMDGESLTAMDSRCNLRKMYYNEIKCGSLTKDSLFYGFSERFIEEICLIDEAKKYTTLFTASNIIEMAKGKRACRVSVKTSTYSTKFVIREAIKQILRKCLTYREVLDRYADRVVVVEINDSFSEKKFLLSTIRAELKRMLLPERSTIDYMLAECDKDGIPKDYGQLHYMVIQNKGRSIMGNDLIGDDIGLSIFAFK